MRLRTLAGLIALSVVACTTPTSSATDAVPKCATGTHQVGNACVADGPIFAEGFYSPAFNVPLGTVTSAGGCQWSVSAAGELSVNLVEQAAGSVAGTAASQPTFQISVVSGSGCTAGPFTVDGRGSISGNDASFHANVADGAYPSFGMSYSGVRSGNTIAGEVTISYMLHGTGGDAGSSYPVSGTINLTLTKQ